MLAGIWWIKANSEWGNNKELEKTAMEKNKHIRSNLDSTGLKLDERFIYWCSINIIKINNVCISRVTVRNCNNSIEK